VDYYRLENHIDIGGGEAWKKKVTNTGSVRKLVLGGIEDVHELKTRGHQRRVDWEPRRE